MLEEYLSTGQLPQAPRELLREEFLERMGQELVRLCDNMERHGLVDYQMGVWEEEIIDGSHTHPHTHAHMYGNANVWLKAIQECLRLLEGSAEQMDVSTIPTSRSQASR